MKRQFDTYPPLELLKQTTATFPRAWEQMKDFHEHNGRDGLSPWKPWCYVPMSGAVAIASRGAEITPENNDLFMEAIPQAQRIAALAPWRLSKEVYVLDPDFETLLFEQAEALEVPSEIFLQLPYQCFYIQFNSLVFEDVAYHGVFVHLEHDANSGDRELRLLYLTADGETLGFPIHIDEKSVADGVNHTRREAYANIKEKGLMSDISLIADTQSIDALISFLGKTLQVVMYICAANAKITPDPEQHVVMQRGTVVKDRYAEIRKWDVGVRIGSAIRAKTHAMQETKGETEHVNHASPRPHMRRGHWHHYWTGKLDDAANRKLILKWNAPTAVGMMDENVPVVIHRADGDESDTHG